MRLRAFILTTLIFVPFFTLATDFSRTLKVGMRGEDVRALQQFLNTVKETRVADTGAGSLGNETDYFGLATKRAVIKFQEKYRTEVLAPIGLAHGTGFFGEKTRAKVATMKSTEVRPSDTGNTPKSSILSTISKEIKSLFASSTKKATSPEEAEKYYNNFIEIAGRAGFTADEFNDAKKDPDLGGTVMMLGDLLDLAASGTDLTELKSSFLAWNNLNTRMVNELKKESTSFYFHETIIEWFEYSAEVAQKLSNGNLTASEVNTLIKEFDERGAVQRSTYETSVALLEKTNSFSFIPHAQAVTCGAVMAPNFYHFGGYVIAPFEACVVATTPATPGDIVLTVSTPCGGSVRFPTAILAAMVAKGLNKPTLGAAILGRSTTIPGACSGAGASPPVWGWEFVAVYYGTSKLP